ncbi:MAG: UDP-N-acetylmuramate dehydrogenase, partial [Microbacteriaceae bacterium]|nr:UDP-N-acetylmuramate dehydrogenase [Microbacteriaceae bacterium]
MSPSPMGQSAKFSELTTIAVGGTAREMVSATHAKQLVDTALEVWAGGENWLLLGGGSNTIVADDGFDGIVIRVATRGIERLRVEPDRSGKVLLRVQAGESWDDVVRYTVEHGWAGIEALSGIPGSSGAAPVQNIGAYGQELSSSLVAIEFLDYLSGELRRIPAGELGLGYRTSALKQGRLGVVVSVELELDAGTDEDGVGATALSRPIAYAQLASALGVGIGDRVPLAEVRATVLELRAAKGMLLSESDPESVSAG